mmetsp:Transcript_58449/g.69770  ORF Transcript_58449/g.69770 Transcript_58449/m.69770 type:complete len:117 (-) Transcript_58449:1780-2130(-)
MSVPSPPMISPISNYESATTPSLPPHKIAIISLSLMLLGTSHFHDTTALSLSSSTTVPPPSKNCDLRLLGRQIEKCGDNYYVEALSLLQNNTPQRAQTPPRVENDLAGIKFLALWE